MNKKIRCKVSDGYLTVHKKYYEYAEMFQAIRDNNISISENLIFKYVRLDLSLGQKFKKTILKNFEF